MYSVGVIVGGGIFVWLFVLSFFVWKQKISIKKLFPKGEGQDIRGKFEEVVGEVEGFKSYLDKLKDNIDSVHQKGLGHIQKIETLRYNPYGDTGGDQSFSVVMLDGRGNGFVMTSLHARSGTRVFLKPVTKGEEKYELSREEREVLTKALKV